MVKFPLTSAQGLVVELVPRVSGSLGSSLSSRAKSAGIKEKNTRMLMTPPPAPNTLYMNVSSSDECRQWKTAHRSCWGRTDRAVGSSASGLSLFFCLHGSTPAALNDRYPQRCTPVRLACRRPPTLVQQQKKNHHHAMKKPWKNNSRLFVFTCWSLFTQKSLQTVIVRCKLCNL